MRILETVRFSIMLDCGAPQINAGGQITEDMLKMQPEEFDKRYDYESIPVLREFKVNALRDIIKQAVDRKYKISFSKGMQMAFEAAIIFLLMISIVVKANLFSLLFLIFIFKFALTTSKTELLVRANTYMCILFMVEYIVYLLNMTKTTSPRKYPKSWLNYPMHDWNSKKPYEMNVEFPVPVFFYFTDIFKDHGLELAYLLGIGIDRDQLNGFIIDFVLIYVIQMYILHYRNPILMKRMQKVFWQFPTPDNLDQWKRLDPLIQKQVLWLYAPIESGAFDEAHEKTKDSKRESG